MCQKKCLVKFAPPPWLWCEDPRPILFDVNDSLYKVLLNYAFFFGRKKRRGDKKVIWDLPGFFCLRVGRSFYYMDLIPGFFLTRLSDFVRVCEKDCACPIEVGYYIYQNANIPTTFSSVRKSMTSLVTEIESSLCGSYKQILSRTTVGRVGRVG